MLYPESSELPFPLGSQNWYPGVYYQAEYWKIFFWEIYKIKKESL